MRLLLLNNIPPLLLVCLFVSGCATTPAPEPVMAAEPPVQVEAAPPPQPGPKPETIEQPQPQPKAPPPEAVVVAQESEATAPEPAPPAKTVEEPIEKPAVVVAEPKAGPVQTPPEAGTSSLPRTEETPLEVAKKPEPPAPTVSFLHPGEVLEFRMSWKIFSHVGDTKIETIEETVEGKKRLRINISTKSRGLLDAIYPVVNDSVSILDPATGRPLSIGVEGKSGSRPEKTLTVFDYDKHQVVHTDYVRPQKSGVGELPDEPAYDLMVAMLRSREWKLKPGETREVLTVFDEDIYRIKLSAIEREQISTDVGKFDAVKIEATQEGEQRGYFKKGGAFRYWVREGDDPQVVKMQFKTNAGTLTAVLHELTRGKD